MFIRQFLSICFYGYFLLFPYALYAEAFEPRLYSNLPVGSNFVLAGYDYTEGALPSNPQAGLEDPSLEIDTLILGYARAFDIMGDSAKIDVGIPYSCIHGDATYKGLPVERDICGKGDIKGRISWNIYGAPALSRSEFSSYTQDTIVGISLQVTAPTGQYDETKLINVGMNRWAFKPGVGVSKKIGNTILELISDVEFYTHNDAFFGDTTLKQNPVYSSQAHIVYYFTPSVWCAVNANYYWGGETYKNGEWQDDSLNNSRTGIMMGIPLFGAHSLKIYGTTGISARYGMDFDRLGAAWQYYWN